MKYLTNWNAKTRVDDLLTTDRYPTAPSEVFVRYFPQARLWIVGVWNSIRHVHQTSSRRDADASKQVGEPGIGAKGVPERLYFEVSETIEPLLVSLF